MRDGGAGWVRDGGGWLLGDKCIGNLSSRPVFDGMRLCIGETFSCDSTQFGGDFLRCHAIEDVYVSS